MSSSATTYDVSVYIGRFQPFHKGQLAVLQGALALAPLCVVVLGSALQARTPKNPFTWQERAEMIRQALPSSDRDRLVFLPLRDYFDMDRWVAAVKQGVAACTHTAAHADNAAVVLVGHFKDASSQYLQHFPGWALDALPAQGPIHATALRDAYFGSAQIPGALEPMLAQLATQVPQSTVQFLRAWAHLPYFAALAQEWHMLRQEKARWAMAPYPPVFVTVDAIVHCQGQVLLIQRGRAPGKGLWAVPGGFIEQHETLYQSALRELHEETGLQLADAEMRQCFKAVQVFDHPGRSLRGRVITHAHFFDLGARALPPLQAADDAADAVWLPVEKLLAMEDQFHDDHFHMLDFFLTLTPRG